MWCRVKTLGKTPIVCFVLATLMLKPPCWMLIKLATINLYSLIHQIYFSLIDPLQ